jgi:hypothetical protein
MILIKTATMYWSLICIKHDQIKQTQ